MRISSCSKEAFIWSYLEPINLLETLSTINQFANENLKIYGISTYFKGKTCRL